MQQTPALGHTMEMLVTKVGLLCHRVRINNRNGLAEQIKQ